MDKRFTWNGESVFADGAAWEAAVDSVVARLPDLAEFKSHLGESPDTLADWFDAAEGAQRLMGMVSVYATMSYSVDAGDQAAGARVDRARTASAQLGATMAFAIPEMISIGFPKLREWVSSSMRLAHLGHYVDRLEKMQSHVRSPEVEALLTQASDPLSTALSVHGVLANTDLRFAPASGAGGEEEVAQGTIGALLTSPDRDLRRTAFESYADAHLAMRHAMAANLAAGVKRDVFYSRARGYSTSLEGALQPNLEGVAFAEDGALPAALAVTGVLPGPLQELLRVLGVVALDDAAERLTRRQGLAVARVDVADLSLRDCDQRGDVDAVLPAPVAEVQPAA